MFCHGSPGSRLQRRVFMNDLSGVRMITPDRPGCGQSDYQPGRRIGDWVDDATVLVEHLGLSGLGVPGFSGGTPYAIAAATPDLPVRAMGIVSGDAPPGRLSDVPTGLGDVAERWPRIISLLLRFSGFIARVAPDFTANCATSSLSPPDQLVVAEPRIRSAFLEMLRDALRQGPKGALLDLQLAAREWERGTAPRSDPGSDLAWGGRHGCPALNRPLLGGEAARGRGRHLSRRRPRIGVRAPVTTDR
ncbi:MAG: alpha/beta fold hydrolase, partial [Acidimicrobiia bacterium]